MTSFGEQGVGSSRAPDHVGSPELARPEGTTTASPPSWVSELHQVLTGAEGWFALSRQAPLIAVMLDPSARLFYCNDHLLRVTGWTRSEIIGKDWFQTFQPPPFSETQQIFESVLNGKSEFRRNENDLLTRTGERCRVRWQNSVIRGASGQVLCTASVGDVVVARPVRDPGDEILVEQRTPEEILSIAREFLNEPDAHAPAFTRLIAEHCAQLAEECGKTPEGLAIAAYIRRAFRVPLPPESSRAREQ